MGMKNVLLPDHIPLNNYDLIVVGGPNPIRFTSISGIEQALETVDLPDRTKASGGNVGAIEFTATHPKHHTIEDAFLESWFQEGQDPVLPTYKKAATLLVRSISTLNVRSYTLINLFVMNRALPDMEMGNEGELFMTTWTFAADNIFPT